MLISKEVEVTLAGKWIKYYEDLGYKIPRVTRYYEYDNHSSYSRTFCPNGAKIKVKVEDLPLGSASARVKCKCDNCGKITEMSYSKYIKQNTNGITYCYDCRKIRTLGEKHFNWNSSLTQEERERKRVYPEYTLWSKRVLARDNYTCCKCGKKSDGGMCAHHINGYDWCKEERTDVKNGITLCGDCHKNFHLIYGYGNNTRQQFEEWFDKPLDMLNDYNGNIPTSVPIVCLETEELITNITEFCREHKLVPNCLRNSCKEHIPSKGYNYMYYDEYKDLSIDEINKEILRTKDGYHNRKIVQLDKNNNILHIFTNVHEAQKFIGAKSAGAIGAIARHKKGYKTSFGYKWEYLDYYFYNMSNCKTVKKLLDKYWIRN